jgi:hypothetical protein
MQGTLYQDDMLIRRNIGGMAVQAGYPQQHEVGEPVTAIRLDFDRATVSK